VPKEYLVAGAVTGDDVVRMLVLPPAGVGAAFARPLAQHCPPGWLVMGARLPGRESRHKDVFTSMNDLIDELTRTCMKLPGSGPLLIVGVCSGGFISVELARALSAIPEFELAGLCLVAPSRPDLDTRSLADPGAVQQLIHELIANGSIPPAVARSEEAMTVLLPALLQDIEMFSAYVPPRASPLSAPVLVLEELVDEGSDDSGGGSWGDVARVVVRHSIRDASSVLMRDFARLPLALERYLPLFGFRQ